MTVTWRCDRRERDYDNFCTRTKPYVDALVKEGFLAKDSNKVIKDYRMRFEYSKQEETIITITEA